MAHPSVMRAFTVPITVRRSQDITTRPNHPLPRQDLHLRAYPRLKATPRNFLFRRAAHFGRCAGDLDEERMLLVTRAIETRLDEFGLHANGIPCFNIGEALNSSGRPDIRPVLPSRTAESRRTTGLQANGGGRCGIEGMHGLVWEPRNTRNREDSGAFPIPCSPCFPWVLSFSLPRAQREV